MTLQIPTDRGGGTSIVAFGRKMPADAELASTSTSTSASNAILTMNVDDDPQKQGGPGRAGSPPDTTSLLSRAGSVSTMPSCVLMIRKAENKQSHAKFFLYY